ncbi:solute carrier family 22 member 11 [Carlito syrichta]|uniref:Solute carrier family 22 member 11 n=1 Tax=Carlito syrichta TaxID=1868482 RepID=A0A1U7SYY5_CARSF|nr:solute carrier family 22 member 11 [Carlito syrichta]
MAFTEVLEQAGGMGLFQTLLVLSLFLPSVLVPSQTLLENFSAAIPGHRCWTHVLDNGSEVPANVTPEALLAVSIPPGPDGGPHRCRRFRQPQWQLLDPNATAANWSEAATEPCVDGWVYDRSTFTSTIVAQWDLVCSSQSLKPLAQSLFMFGNLVGSSFWGLLSCRFGRKPILNWCYLQIAATGTSAIFAPSFPVYCVLRFLNAFALTGVLMTSMVLMVEWTATHRRAFTLTVLGCANSMGQMAMGTALPLHSHPAPTPASSLRRQWLPESARWLLTVGKPEQALRGLRKVARINGHQEAKKTLTIEVLMSSMEEEAASAKDQRSVLDLLRVPTLRRRIWTMLVVSFSMMFSYYGLVLDLQSLGRDIFLLQTLFGAVDFLGRGATTFLLSVLGRRTLLASFQTTAGLSILANVLVPQDLQTVRVGFAVLAKGCFGVSTMCFSIYKAELVPTPLRMTVDGFLLSLGRLGAMVGPLIMMTRPALPLLSPLSYGILPIASSLLALLLLPETGGLPLPDTIQDLESQSVAARGSRQAAVITESTWF